MLASNGPQPQTPAGRQCLHRIHQGGVQPTAHLHQAVPGALAQPIQKHRQQRAPGQQPPGQHPPQRGMVSPGKPAHPGSDQQHRERRSHHPHVEIFQGLDVGHRPAQQVAAGVIREAGWRQRLQRLVKPHPQPRQQAEVDRMRRQPLAIAQQPRLMPKKRTPTIATCNTAIDGCKAAGQSGKPPYPSGRCCWPPWPPLTRQRRPPSRQTAARKPNRRRMSLTTHRLGRSPGENTPPAGRAIRRVCANLHHPPGLQHQDGIGLLQGRQAVGNHHHRPPLSQAVDRLA